MIEPYYSEDGITIYNADCREVLPHLESVDLVLTSPPYNLGEGMEDKGGLRVGHKGSKWGKDDLRNGYGKHADAMPYSDYVAWQKEVLGMCWNLLSNSGAIYYQHKCRIVKGECRTPLEFNPDLPLRQIVTWDRGSGFNYQSGAYMPVVEWLLVFARPDFLLRDKGASGVGDCWRIPPELRTPHPAPFPLALAKQAISTTRARTILDPFMGSGTTLRAAKDLGLKSIGIEIEKKYCDIAIERLRQQAFSFEAAR